MPTLIKDGAIAENQWTLIEDKTVQNIDDLPGGPVIVPLVLWQNNKQTLKQRDAIGVWLDSDELPENIKDDLDSFELVALNFPVFTDGRAFSYARAIREQQGYSGEIRAIGNFLIDQLYYMSRCGFNAFVLKDDSENDTAIAALSTFSEDYQADARNKTPLLLRR